MYPNQAPPSPELPQPQPEYGIDYLNQISAPQQVKKPNPLLLMIVALGGLLAIMAFGFIIFNSGPKTVDKVASLNIRLGSLQQLATTAQRSLRDNDLRSINAEFLLYLSNTLRDIKEPVQKLGASSEGVTKPLASKEAAYVSALQSEFEEAKLNVMFDRAYAREMAYQINVVRSQMSTVYKNTSSTTLKQALETSDASLAQSNKRFTGFSGVN